MAGYSRFRRSPQGPARALQRELRRAFSALPEPSVRADAEGALAAARRMHRRQAEALREDFLAQAIHASALGRGLCDLADSSLDLLLRHAEQPEGGAPCPFVVAALGKYGGRELTYTSDLDLVFIHGGANPDHAYSCQKIARTLVCSLSAATEEGLLFEVDLRLRPHGDKGGIVSSLSAFSRYYSEDAWTWELMALTRLRPAAGDMAFGAQVRAAARRALCAPRETRRLMDDIAAMRARLDCAHPAAEPLDVKHGPGGLMDIEFAAQAAMLASAQTSAPVIEAQPRLALRSLAERGFIGGDCLDVLLKALALFTHIQHAQRAAAPGTDAYLGCKADLEREALRLRPLVRAALMQVLEADAPARIIAA